MYNINAFYTRCIIFYYLFFPQSHPAFLCDQRYPPWLGLHLSPHEITTGIWLTRALV